MIWRRSLIVIGLALVVLAAVIPTPAQAQGLAIDCEKVVIVGGKAQVTSRCTIEDLVEQFVRLSQFGLTIVVFLGVLMLVYAGWEFITAGGRSAKIESGKNIMSGTLIGILISFSAYVIVNFAVGAITGTSVTLNPLSAIATVFRGDRVDNRNIERPFSGVSDKSTTQRCREEWDTSCNHQAGCADIPERNGPVQDLQRQLKALSCGCEVNGCFGAATATCVRNFQLANKLVPSGVMDNSTELVLSGSPVRCDSVLGAELAGVVAQAAVKPTHANIMTKNGDSQGCCVVKAAHDQNVALYCLNSLSERACAALGNGYVYTEGRQCAESPETNTLCGFCQSAGRKCFEEVGQYWCQNIAVEPGLGTPLTFRQGICRGGLTGICEGSNNCQDALLVRPE